ncbi:MAG: diphosphomevalonate decarboxylase [Pseudomonadota bacterium]
MTLDAGKKADILERLLPSGFSFKGSGTAYAPSNIALSKYWGKRDAALNLPCNSSLSISLGAWGSKTTIDQSSTSQDEIFFNQVKLEDTDPQARKILAHVDLFRRTQNIPLRIVTSNSIPTAAGLASSASGFAALTLALDRALGLGLSTNVLSMMARFGSGSAARSLWHGFVKWERGIAPDGTDSVGHPVDVSWPELRIAIVPVDTAPKKFSSRDGMTHTLATSPLFQAWPDQAENDCTEIEAAVRARDLRKLGALAESNALAMHATMMAARPSLNYLTPDSWQVLTRLWAAREEGLAAYATMDAGANVKLLFEARDSDSIQTLFPNATVIAPFDNPPEL